MSKLRLYARNAEAWGAFAEDVPPTVAGGRVEFSCNIDSSAAQAENIIITGGGETIPVTITGTGSNYLLFSPDVLLITQQALRPMRKCPLKLRISDWKIRPAVKL